VSRGSTLILEREWKLASLVDPPPEGSTRFEASGIVACDRGFIVVFDNVTAVVRLRSERREANASWIQTSVAAEGFEDIAYDSGRGRYFLLVESEPLRDGRYSSIIHQVDDRFAPMVRGRIAVPFEKRNKGFEGLAWTMRKDRGYLLAIPEGGKPGSRPRRKPYRCRIYVLRQSRKGWKPVAKFKLPRAARLKDYAALAIRGHRLAVVSQESSAVWVGRLHPSRWEVVDDGQVYGFPRDEDDRVVYGNVEGVAWLSSARIVAVSDRASRRSQPSRYRTKDESIHIFRIP
jgi:hypothetical protein